MRNLLLSVVAVTMTWNASFALAQTELQQKSRSEAVPHTHDHASHQHDETREKLPTSKEKAHTAGPHGGNVQEIGQLRVETIVEPGGLRLFIYGPNGKALDLSGTRGLVTLQIDGDAKRYRYDLFPEVGEDKQAESMAVAVDLSRMAGRNVKLAYQLVGVQGAGRKPLQFSATASVPMTEAQRVAAAIAEQKVCPVSGQPLGGMGKPIPVTVGDQTVYVCCAGCIDAVKENPAKYFPAKQVKLTVAKATAADADAIATQKVCPVMDEPLGGMGTPLKVTGLRRDVYLCCKGCLKFLEKDPEKYLAMLPPLPESAKPALVKATEADARFVAAQELCPVMDEPLDAMGGPYKTVVEGRVVYLCCPGCAKKLYADPTKYLDKLAKQGVTPPAVQ